MDRIRNAVTRARQTRDSNRTGATVEAPPQPASISAAAQQEQSALESMRPVGELAPAGDSLGLPELERDF